MTKARAIKLPGYREAKILEDQKAKQAEAKAAAEAESKKLVLKKSKFPQVEPSPKKKFNIKKLSYELRHQILEEMAPTTIAVFLPGVSNRYFRSAPTKIPLPSITRAGDKILRLEAIVACLRKGTIEIHSEPGNFKLRQWLASIDFSPLEDPALRTGFDAVHSLRFP